MRAPILIVLAVAMLAACDDRPAATVNAANFSAGNMATDAPMNDQSAMESATNAGLTPPAPPPPPTGNATPATPNSAGTAVIGETSGGDTGGNTVGNRTSM